MWRHCNVIPVFQHMSFIWHRVSCVLVVCKFIRGDKHVRPKHFKVTDMFPHNVQIIYFFPYARIKNLFIWIPGGIMLICVRMNYSLTLSGAFLTEHIFVSKKEPLVTTNIHKSASRYRKYYISRNITKNDYSEWCCLDHTLDGPFDSLKDHDVKMFPVHHHYSDVIWGAIASQITSLTIVYSTVCSGVDQRKHQSSASLAIVRGIHRWPVNSPHKWPLTRKVSIWWRHHVKSSR